MNDCKHNNLLLLSESKHRLQCRNCHLTITEDELGGSFCPECYDRDGSKQYDFDDKAEPNTDTIRYRCEDCGILIEGD